MDPRHAILVRASHRAVAVVKRLAIGALLAFAGSVLLGFGVRAGLESSYITGGSNGGVPVDGRPSEAVVIPCGSLLAPAYDPDPAGCAALREQAKVPTAVLSFLGLCVIAFAVVLLVTGRPKARPPANRNPWELGETAT